MKGASILAEVILMLHQALGGRKGNEQPVLQSHKGTFRWGHIPLRYITIWTIK